jgi:hypothetical protein
LKKSAQYYDTVHFSGWADCEWKEAEGLVRAEKESMEEFFERIKIITNKKWIWY